MATLTRVLFLQTHGLPRNISIQTRSLPAEAHNFRHRCRPRRKWTTCPVLQPEETQLLLDLCRLHHTPPLLTPALPPLPRPSGSAPQNLGHPLFVSHPPPSTAPCTLACAIGSLGCSLRIPFLTCLRLCLSVRLTCLSLLLTWRIPCGAWYTTHPQWFQANL